MADSLTRKLDKILKNQKQIFEELNSIKRQLKGTSQCMRMQIKSLDQLQTKTTQDVKCVEMKVLGLTSVVEHIQDRLLQVELARNDFSSCQSSTSSGCSAYEKDSQTARYVSMTADCKQTEQACNHQGLQTHSSQQWLQDNHLKLVKGIDPSNCLLLDYLLQDDILSDSDEEDIRAWQTRRNQTRELLFKMRRAGNEKIGQFVKHLEKEFPHLVHDFCSDSETGEKNNCVACDVVKQVSIDDVIDVLLQEDVVDDNLYEKIWRYSTNKKGWSRLLKNMHHAQMPKCLSVLAQALVQKYPQICRRISESGIKTLKCCCYKQAKSSRKYEVRKRVISYKKFSKPTSYINFIELYKRYQMNKLSMNQGFLTC